jgi:TolB-like protein/class 3 adenylate cyclase
MAEEGFKRKLAAILSADVEGYSRLMDDDEEATVRTLTSYRNAITDLVQQFRGRVVDAPGDNLLAEFTSVVDAVNCAVEIQRDLAERNTELAYNRQMQFRIGVNLGDVIEEDGRIYGDGVNIAARVESLAEAGGICISGRAYDQVANKLGLEYENLGEHQVKNISVPIRVYRVLSHPGAAAHRVVQAKETLGRKWRKVAISAAVVIVVVAALGIWYFYMRSPEIEPASVAQMADPLPDKPSIAVLPFDNMSGDPEQEYFSDGLTDELIGNLAKISGILVISRNSAFTYKGKQIKISQVAKELNVSYVLEGSVQKSGDKVRIRAQLIDGKTDHHLWSESYDGVMDDIFELQDQITGKIVSALAVTLTPDEQDRISDKGTDNILAYEAFLKGYEHYTKFTAENLLKSIEYYKQAIQIDPKFSRAYSAAALGYFMLGLYSFPKELGISPPEGAALRYKARQYLDLSMQNPTFDSYRLASYMAAHRRRFDDVIVFAEKSLLMAPNEYLANLTMGHSLNWLGRGKEALVYIDKAIQLDPRHLDVKLGEQGISYFVLGEYEKAVESIQRCLTLNPRLTVYAAYAAASFSFLDRIEEAENAWKIFVEGFLEEVRLTTALLYYFTPFEDTKIFDHLVDGLAKAGFEGDPSDYHKVNKEYRLNGQAIKELLFGKIQLGTIAGIEISSYRSDTGELELNIPMFGISDNGKSWIEGDMVCNQYNMTYDGVKFCADVYANPDGNFDQKNQYLLVSDAIIFPFSIKE